MQCVILAGGLATRMLPLTRDCPKTLLPVAGRPFAWWQLQWLAAHGVDDVVYSIGHHGARIRAYWESEPPPVARLRFVDEGRQLRGTGGALKLAALEGALDPGFLVLYGDSFLPIDFAAVWGRFEESGAGALMTVLCNEGRWDRANAIYERGRVVVYDKRPHPRMRFIDYGLSALRRGLIEKTPGDIFDLADLFRDLSAAGGLAGYEVHERFYEIGSPGGLRDFEAYLQARSRFDAGMPI